MSRFASLKVSVGMFAFLGLGLFVGCGTTETPATDATVQDDTSGSDAIAGSDAAADAPADVPTDTGAVCTLPCVTPGGQEDVSLCGNVSKYTCQSGCCVAKFACKVDADCASRIGMPECSDKAFTCVCNQDNATCIQGQCRADGDCGSGQVCSQGGCIAAPAKTGLHAKLLRLVLIAKPGQVVDLVQDLGAQAVDDKGNVVASATFTCAVTGTGAPTVTAGKVTLPDAAGDFTVTCKVDGGDGKDSNPATIRDIGKPGTVALRVSAYDEETLAPLTGKIVVVDNSTATTPTAAVSVELVNGQATVATLTFPADIHVISPNHAPVSILTYKPEGASGEVIVTSALVSYADVALSDENTVVLSKIVDDAGKVVTEGSKFINCDAISGNITYSGVGEASLGLTSLGFGNGLLSFSIDSILGPNVTRKFDKDAPTFLNPGAYNKVPGGVTFGLGKPVITKYLLAGTPGKHKVWTLAGHIELATLYAQIGKVFDAIDGGVDIGKIVSVLLPYLSTFYSQVVDDVAFGATLTTPLHEVDLNPLFPLLIKTVITPPKLPSMGDGTYADLIFAIGGALLPSGEIVPLGLTAASDKNEKTDPSDGIVDGDPETPGDQTTLTLAMAPLHSGLQFGQANHVIISAAVVIAGNGHKEGGSIQITQPDVAPATLTVPSFLPLPIGSVFDEKAGTIKVLEVTGADFYRVNFVASQGANWTVMLPKSAIGTAVALPDIKTLGADQDYRKTAKQANVGAFVLKTPATVQALLGAGTLTDLVRSVKMTSFTNAKL